MLGCKIRTANRGQFILPCLSASAVSAGIAVASPLCCFILLLLPLCDEKKEFHKRLQFHNLFSASAATVLSSHTDVQKMIKTVLHLFAINSFYQSHTRSSVTFKFVIIFSY